MEDIEFLVKVPVTNRRLNELFVASSASHRWKDFEAILGHSLGFVCAYSGGELIGFVDLAWDDFPERRTTEARQTTLTLSTGWPWYPQETLMSVSCACNPVSA